MPAESFNLTGNSDSKAGSSSALRSEAYSSENFTDRWKDRDEKNIVYSSASWWHEHEKAKSQLQSGQALDALVTLAKLSGSMPKHAGGQNFDFAKEVQQAEAGVFKPLANSADSLEIHKDKLNRALESEDYATAYSEVEGIKRAFRNTTIRPIARITQRLDLEYQDLNEQIKALENPNSLTQDQKEFELIRLRAEQDGLYNFRHAYESQKTRVDDYCNYFLPARIKGAQGNFTEAHNLFLQYKLRSPDDAQGEKVDEFLQETSSSWFGRHKMLTTVGVGTVAGVTIMLSAPISIPTGLVTLGSLAVGAALGSEVNADLTARADLPVTGKTRIDGAFNGALGAGFGLGAVAAVDGALFDGALEAGRLGLATATPPRALGRFSEIGLRESATGKTLATAKVTWQFAEDALLPTLHALPLTAGLYEADQYLYGGQPLWSSALGYAGLAGPSLAMSFIPKAFRAGMPYASKAYQKLKGVVDSAPATVNARGATIVIPPFPYGQHDTKQLTTLPQPQGSHEPSQMDRF